MRSNTDQTSSTFIPASNHSRTTLGSLMYPANRFRSSEANRPNFAAFTNVDNTSNTDGSNSLNTPVGFHSAPIYPPIGATATVTNTLVTKQSPQQIITRSTTARPATPQRESSRMLTEEIKQTVREEIERMANELIRQEVEKEIENKIGSKKISTSRRSRVYKKVNDELKKQIQETIEKVVEDQLNTQTSAEGAEGTKTDNGEIEDRVSDEIAAKLTEFIRSLLNRSMEKAIADEMIEQVKIEKLTRTPTIVPEFQVPSTFGVRHTQTFMVLLFLLISYWQRVDFNTGIVAMNDSNRSNPDFIEFNWGETKMAVLFSIFYCGYFVLQIPGGILAEKYGPKLVMTVSMMACSLLVLLIPVTALFGGWIALLVLKFLQGAVQGVFIPTVYIFTSRWIPPKEKSKLFTPAFGGMQLGIVFGMPVTGILCDSFLGWPSAFFFSSCIGFFWVATWVLLAANSPSVHRSISREEKLYIEGSFGFGEITLKGAEKIIPWKSILKCVPFWALVICHFGQNWALTILITEMPVYNNHVLKLKIAENASWSAMCYLVGWVFIIIFGFLATVIESKRWISLSIQRKAWNTVSALGGTGCFLILCYTRTKEKYFVIALFTIALATNSACYNGLFSNHADLSPNYIGILMGLSNMVGNVASMLAPVFVGYVVHEWDDLDQWSVVFITSAIILFSTNIIFILFGTSNIQPWNTPSDLHLHLEDVDTAAATRIHHQRRPGRGQTYVVASTRHNEISDQDSEFHSPLPSRQHRKSI